MTPEEAQAFIQRLEGKKLSVSAALVLAAAFPEQWDEPPPGGVPPAARYAMLKSVIDTLAAEVRRMQVMP